jgi:hypothetical protein
MTNLIYEALMRIVINYPQTKAGRLNTFAILPEWQDLQSESLGISANAAERGEYWSRKWSAGGKDPSQICAEFDLLFVTPPDRQTLNCLGALSGSLRIGVVVPQVCDGCENRGSVFAAERDAKKLLVEVIRELRTYKLYSNVSVRGVSADFLLSEAQKNYEIALGANISNLSACKPLINCKDVEIQTASYGGNGLQVAFANIDVCDSGTDAISFMYETLDMPHDFSEVKCKTC